MPSESVEVSSIFHQNRAVRVLMMAVHDMALPMTAIVAVSIDFPDDILWVLLVQRAIRIEARVNEDTVLIDVHQRQSLDQPQVLGGYNEMDSIMTSMSVGPSLLQRKLARAAMAGSEKSSLSSRIAASAAGAVCNKSRS
jgi:hypothetical protein